MYLALMEKDHKSKLDMDLVFTDQLLKKKKTNPNTLTKTTRPTMCAQNPTGKFIRCHSDKFPISNLAQFLPKK